MAYYIGNQEVTEEYWKAHNAAATGAQQIGSQSWMNSDYQKSGAADPSLQVKAALSTADYANQWIGNYATQLQNAGVPVSPAVATIAKTSETPSTQTLALWKAAPEISSTGALEDRIAEAGGYTSWASNMGVVTANPATYNNPNSPLAPASPVSGAGAGTVDIYQVPANSGSVSNPTAGGTSDAGTSTDATGGITSLLGTYGIYILAGIIALVFIFLAMGRGSGSGVTA
jgi:hypothetical protein